MDHDQEGAVLLRAQLAARDCGMRRSVSDFAAAGAACRCDGVLESLHPAQLWLHPYSLVRCSGRSPDTGVRSHRRLRKV